MRGSHSHSSSSSSHLPSHGQMYINMKTTVTTSGGQHNGLVVHSAIQSASTPSTSSNWMSPYMESPAPSNRRLEDRIEMIRSNSSLHRDHSGTSPLPIQMVPSTSRETLVSIPRRESRDTSPHVGFVNRPPSPPPSPIYSFKGRDSPPDEFIQPTKLVLNVFRPSHREPQWQVPISRNQVESDGGGGGISLSKKNAVLNDAMTTTTTVEVFRAPLDSNVPVIGLPPSPYGGQPLLVRTHGPQYEQWSNQRTQTMLSDEPTYQPYAGSGPKGVQWKERLIEGSNSVDRRYIMDSNSSDYAEIQNTDPQFQYQSQPTQTRIIHNDYRPKSSQMPPPFQPVTHPIIPNSISSSREDLSRSYHQPNTRSMSPLYIVPDRKYNRNSSAKVVSPGYNAMDEHRGYRDRDAEDDGEDRDIDRRAERDNQERERYRDRDRERDRHRNGDRYHHRRSKSTNREDESSSRHRNLRHRSMSPSHRSQHGGSQEFVLPAHSPIGSTLMLASPDPNELPGRPASARSQEIFALYQTRDAYNRVVDQL